MDFEFSADQEMLRDSVRRFFAERAPIAYVRAQYDDPGPAATDDVWSGLCDLGVAGLIVDARHGGAGAGMADAAVVLEEAGRALYPGPYVSSAIGAASLVSTAGSRVDHAQLLPSLASGTRIGTLALEEPGRGAEWRDPQTTAARTEGGGFALTGTKVHVADATVADLLLVTATQDGRAGDLGVYRVERAAPGLVVEPIATVDGSHKQATVTLSATPAVRLGEGDTTGALSEALDRLSIAAVVDGVGVAARSLELAVEYAKERRQFEQPIGAFQAVQHLCADMLRAVELARAAAYYACWAADAASATERHRAATLAQAFAADELYKVGAALIQVHGGIGFTWEHDAHLFYKRLLTLRELAGGSEGQLEELASIVLGSRT